MKKRVIYCLPGLNALAILSALCMVCSAVARILWAAGEPDLPGSMVWLQILLPLAANLSFVLILLRDGRDRLYRTAIPVWLGCVFFAVKALGFPSRLHTVLCLLLYALVAVLYTLTVTGRIPTQKLLWPLFSLPLLYHIFVEDAQKIGWPLHDWLPEISVLLCMLSLLLVSLAMKKRLPAPGEHIRSFGDRNDGRRLRSLSPIFAVSPFIMKTRNTPRTTWRTVSRPRRWIATSRRSGRRACGASALSTCCCRPISAPAPGIRG